MTKKDYEAIAKILSHEVNVAKTSPVASPSEKDTRVATVRIVAQKIAYHAATRDKKFDRVRFMKACGVAYPDHGGDGQ